MLIPRHEHAMSRRRKATPNSRSRTASRNPRPLCAGRPEETECRGQRGAACSLRRRRTGRERRRAFRPFADADDRAAGVQ
ncbi:hypothetical protein GCM10010358_52590 [Streptomyces minutiscleroticus]|uniref:Uncharacterized protein n=1 Tax=Streptomyces minutiscleroticus TaxID=68238 RepID=A0A918NSL8_9ACTN|nr:hypothetical protein GCM10010358_52590 [Streptomyces minutiscleroticus]